MQVHDAPGLVRFLPCPVVEGNCTAVAGTVAEKGTDPYIGTVGKGMG